MAAQGGDPVRYSDYNALYTTINSIVGPLQQTAPGVYVKGTGYGVPNSSLASLQYPFVRTITNISNTNPAQITTSLPHNLVSGEKIYIDGITNPTWSTTAISGNYFVVDQILSTTVFSLLNVDTRVSQGYPAWAGSGNVSQYVISANQFNNLRSDLALAYKHVYGAAPDAATLPIPTRNSLIQYSVYLPYYNTVTAVNAAKLVCQETTVYGYPTTPQRNGASSPFGNGSMFVDFTIEWPTAYDFVQYFNTGSYFNFSSVVDQVGNGPSNSAAENQDWQDLNNKMFPMNYGAYNKATMGYTDSSKWSTQGAFDASLAGLTQVQQVQSTTTNYTNNTITFRHRALTDRKLQLQFEYYNGHSNGFSPNVTSRFTFTLTFYYTFASINLNQTPFSSPGIQVSFTKSFS
jgi:hypothetical protein